MARLINPPLGARQFDGPGFDALAVGRRVLAIEASALRRLSEELGSTFGKTIEKLVGTRGKVVCMGVGKSGHVAQKIAATLASTGTPSTFVHLAEASHGDLGMITKDDLVLVLSKSGEVCELADTLAYTKRFSIPLIAVTGSPQSTLGRAADVCLVLPSAPEATEKVCVPTTSTTLQLALGDAMAVALLERRGFTAQEFRLLHPGGSIGSFLTTVADLMHTGDDLPLVQSFMPMPEVLLVMTQKRFGCAAVCDEHQRLRGVITDGDLRRHIDGLPFLTAAEVMTRTPKTVSPDLLAAEALKMMNHSSPRVTVVFAIEHDRPVGVLHVHDLLRAGIL
ncbi:MAG TPA: KpsF/GutQ family sugar-phosphate isomerase [Caulobacteraceae bacterium]